MSIENRIEMPLDQAAENAGLWSKGLVALGIIWAASLVYVLQGAPTWDVAWRFEIAQRMLDGAVLYQDIIEVNPPLWFWAGIPTVAVAEAFQLSPFTVFCIQTHVLLLPILWLLDRSVAPLLSRESRLGLLLTTMIALTWLPMLQFGQRELAFLVATLLWIALALRRAQGLASPLWMILACTAFAAYGFALKHYFVAVPIGVELWLAWQLKRNWHPIRVETVALGGLAIAYALSVLWLAPGFLREVVPLVAVSYEDLRQINVIEPWGLRVSMALSALILYAPFFAMRDAIKADRFAQLLFLTLTLHLLAVIAQDKGFSYHFFGAQGLTIILWAYLVTRPGALSRKACLTACAIAACFGLILAGFFTPAVLTRDFNNSPAGKASTKTQSDIVGFVMSQPTSKRIFVISTNPGMAFYLPWVSGFDTHSRYFSLWMVPGLQSSLQIPARRAAATEQLDKVVANTLRDIQRSAPDIIIGDASYHARQTAAGFEVYPAKPLDTLLENERFRTWLSANYTFEPRGEGFDVWVKRHNS
jgi:hypothetical protein